MILGQTSARHRCAERAKPRTYTGPRLAPPDVRPEIPFWLPVLLPPRPRLRLLIAGRRLRRPVVAVARLALARRRHAAAARLAAAVAARRRRPSSRPRHRRRRRRRPRRPASPPLVAASLPSSYLYLILSKKRA